MKYTINIREIFECLVEVDAGSAEEALLIAKARYDNGDIVLDLEDCKGVEIDEIRQAEPVIRNEQKDSFDIYQLKEESEDEIEKLRFVSYARLTSMGEKVKKSNYRKVYSSELSPGISLEDIFTLFNIKGPYDFNGHRLKVSDVIVIHKNGVDTANYVESFGFKDVPEFLQSDNTAEKINRTKGEELTR